MFSLANRFSSLTTPQSVTTWHGQEKCELDEFGTLLKNYANSADRECGSYTCISRFGTTPAQAQSHAHALLCSTGRWATAGRSIFLRCDHGYRGRKAGAWSSQVRCRAFPSNRNVPAETYQL